MNTAGSSGQGNQGDSVDPPISKKRRGRQPRPSLLTPELLRAIASFTSVVGKPVLQPGGFRDYTGWLDSIAAQHYQSTWLKLARCFLDESRSLTETDIPQLKKDVVTEIMKTVVKRNPRESSKLVSTNARRQCAVPSSGVTVMTLLESYLQQAKHLPSESKQTERHGSEGSSSRGLVKSRGSGHPSGSGGRGHPHGQGSTQRQSGSSSSARVVGSGMDISSLLVDDTPHVHRGSSSNIHRGSSSNVHRGSSSNVHRGSSSNVQRPSSSSAPKLPSLSQLDEQLRVRKEKDRRNPR